jgi:hypothetical protein
MHVHRLTHVRGRSFPCCGLVGLILVIRRSMAYAPSCPPISPACLEALVLAAGVCLTAAFFLSFKKTLLNFPRKCSWRPSKKGKKADAWARRHGKRGSRKTRGHWTTRRQMPTASTNAYRRAGDSCMVGTLVFRGRLLEFSPSTLRRSGAGGREGALVSARCKGCIYDAECSANYTADVYTLLCATHRSLRKK